MSSHRGLFLFDVVSRRKRVRKQRRLNFKKGAPLISIEPKKLRDVVTSIFATYNSSDISDAFGIIVLTGNERLPILLFIPRIIILAGYSCELISFTKPKSASMHM